VPSVGQAALNANRESDVDEILGKKPTAGTAEAKQSGEAPPAQGGGEAATDGPTPMAVAPNEVGRRGMCPLGRKGGVHGPLASRPLLVFTRKRFHDIL
jgi:hypothetical protein